MSQFGNVNTNQYYMNGGLGCPGGSGRLQNQNWMNPGEQMSTFNSGSSLPSFTQMNQGNAMRSTPPAQQKIPDLSYGRIVGSEQDIIPNEVPMDGTYGVFVTSDKSMAMLKTWGSDGLVHTDYYRLVVPEDPSDQNKAADPYDIILKRLDEIDNYLRGTKQEESAQTDPRRPSFSGKKGE